MANFTDICEGVDKRHLFSYRYCALPQISLTDYLAWSKILFQFKGLSSICLVFHVDNISYSQREHRHTHSLLFLSRNELISENCFSAGWKLPLSLELSQERMWVPLGTSQSLSLKLKFFHPLSLQKWDGNREPLAARAPSGNEAACESEGSMRRPHERSILHSLKATSILALMDSQCMSLSHFSASFL